MTRSVEDGGRENGRREILQGRRGLQFRQTGARLGTKYAAKFEIFRLGLI